MADQPIYDARHRLIGWRRTAHDRTYVLDARQRRLGYFLHGDGWTYSASQRRVGRGDLLSALLCNHGDGGRVEVK